MVSLRESEDDHNRLVAAYSLAFAGNSVDSSAALITVLKQAHSEPVRRSAKFGAVAACHQQLLRGESHMVIELLTLIADMTDHSAAACAARALYEHGAWAAAPLSLREHTVKVLSAAIKDP